MAAHGGPALSDAPEMAYAIIIGPAKPASPRALHM